MAKMKEIQLGRPRQMEICRHARQELWRRENNGNPTGGIILADGVGLGKTYEALGTAAALLSQRRHGKNIKHQSFKVLVLVPRALVSKWADEIDRFKSRYLSRAWTIGLNKPVGLTFGKPPAILARLSDLNAHRGKRRYGKQELPPGLYIVTWGMLQKRDPRVSPVRRTRWDIIMVDEAHHFGSKVIESKVQDNAKKTATLLLTATPFQLSPQEFKSLLAATFGGVRDPNRCGSELYGDANFKAYRKELNSLFRTNDDRDLHIAKAGKLRLQVRDLLLPRIVRNPKLKNRRYHVVAADGQPKELSGNPFELDDIALNELLLRPGLIDLESDVACTYARVRDKLCNEMSARKADKTRGTFVAVALRQFLSSWGQFKNSKFGQRAAVQLPASSHHPKLHATVELVARLIQAELHEAADRGWIGKILIFTTYVGAETSVIPTDDTSYGTTAALKRALIKKLNTRLPRATRNDPVRLTIKQALTSVVTKEAAGVLKRKEAQRLTRAIQKFAGSPAATLLLARKANLRREKHKLRKLVQDVQETTGKTPEERRRFRERRERRIRRLLERYTTPDIVARFDGATDIDERERHLHGFNSPYAPLVLIASSVGQEGIDLQQYCRHVVHHDLEWNPAKLEQREGRIDRTGRKTAGPINVYFVLCRGTYDERMMHVMVNRLRWHQVLLATRAASNTNLLPEEPSMEDACIRKIQLDLSPHKL